MKGRNVESKVPAAQRFYSLIFKPRRRGENGLPVRRSSRLPTDSVQLLPTDGNKPTKRERKKNGSKTCA